MIQSGDPTGTGTGGEVFGEKTLIMKYVRNFCLFAVLYVWQIPEQIRMEVSFFIVQAKADTAKKGLEEGNVELTKKTTSVILGSGWISILNRKLYCVWTNDQWI